MCAQTAKQAFRQELLSCLVSYFHADSAFGVNVHPDIVFSDVKSMVSFGLDV